MRKSLVLISILGAMALVGCTRTTSNVHVLSSTDCGATWQKLNVGQSVPKHVGNPCGYNLAVPNWDMAGDTEFRTSFAMKVLATVKMSYTYTITDPVAFVSEARYLGKGGSSLELSADTVGSRYEMAENIIIDKMLREEVTEITRSMNIADVNPAELEDKIYERAKGVLSKKGVEFSDLAMIIENDEQTRLAIDSVTAMRVYEAAGIADVGRAVISARAGATQIAVTSPQAPTQK